VHNNKYYIEPVSGDASLTANFGTNRITGNFNNMVVVDSNGITTPWNAVSVDASIAGKMLITGTTGVSSAPQGDFTLGTNATGTIEGEFYGPSAEEIGAVWTLYDGISAAVGFVGVGTVPHLVEPAVLTAVESRFLGNTPIGGWRNTGVTPAIGDPEPATAGLNPAASATASPSGPTLDGSTTFPPIGTTFPLTQTVMRVSPSTLDADTATNNGGATITLGPFSSTADVTTLTLTIPSLGISQYMQLNGNLGQFSFGGSNGGSFANIATEGLSYLSFGTWNAGTASNGHTTASGAFILGYETPKTAMPTSGIATYTGPVIGTVFVPASEGGTAAVVEGTASFSADFGSGHIAGSFANMKAFDFANPQIGNASGASSPWNNVSISAGIASGGTTFSGTTAAESAPSAPYALKSGATGYINGGFYGPNAEQLGAVWSLSNHNGTGAAIGVVGASVQNSSGTGAGIQAISIGVGNVSVMYTGSTGIVSPP
jgi:hypothetical protein